MPCSEGGPVAVATHVVRPVFRTWLLPLLLLLLLLLPPPLLLLLGASHHSRGGAVARLADRWQLAPLCRLPPSPTTANNRDFAMSCGRDVGVAACGRVCQQLAACCVLLLRGPSLLLYGPS
jgi:hypothetical protein